MKATKRANGKHVKKATARYPIPILLTATAPGAMNDKTAKRIATTVRKYIKGTSLEGAAVLVSGDGLQFNLLIPPPHVVRG